MSTANQFSATLTVEGQNLGVWDTFSGGGTGSEEVRHRPGAMGPEEALGSQTTVENITLSRRYKLERDHNRVTWLRNQAGRGRCTVKNQPLDAQGNPFGRAEVFTGRLMRVTPPERDSTSDDVAMIEVEIVPDGTVA